MSQYQLPPFLLTFDNVPSLAFLFRQSKWTCCVSLPYERSVSRLGFVRVKAIATNRCPHCDTYVNVNLSLSYHVSVHYLI